ncbi:unnamed protein product [Gongylonema pulchrum]|uniref:Uncharacterized protein n=1 Tax=Gongylonema pulchrum TaxID=637853 RepID=A0A3P6QAX4_9BILA|nr:unnamed protein product [Gongylonema pulchrum]
MNSDDNMNLDAALTEYENSAIVIGPEHCQQIETLPIDLFYIGLTDPLRAVMEYKGPGFVRDIKKTLDYIEVPVVPAATPRILSVSELLALTRRPDNACGVVVEKPKDESIAETTQEHKKDDENMICATVVVDLQGKISTIDNNPTNSEEHNEMPSTSTTLSAPRGKYISLNVQDLQTTPEIPSNPFLLKLRFFF